MVIMGDLNGHIAGGFHNQTNKNGQAILDFAAHWDMEILHNNQATFRGRHGNPSLVDYVLITREITRNVQSHTIYDTAITSDHSMLITNLKPTSNMTVKPRSKRLKTHRLRDPKIAKEYQERIKKELD